MTAPMRTLAAAVMAAAILFPFAATAQSPIIIKFSHVVAPDTPKGNPHLVSVPKVRSEPEHRKRCCRALALKSTSAPEGQAAAKFLDRHARSRPGADNGTPCVAGRVRRWDAPHLLAEPRKPA